MSNYSAFKIPDNFIGQRSTAGVVVAPIINFQVDSTAECVCSGSDEPVVTGSVSCSTVVLYKGRLGSSYVYSENVPPGGGATDITIVDVDCP